MRISFDLDDTLFVSPETFDTEKELRFPFNRIYRERLRKGTVDLIRELQAQGDEVWIYTSSFRTEKYIKKLFANYGVTIETVVNGSRHRAEVQGNRKEPMPSKYPSKYQIDLHVDDDISVFQNGKRYGFHVHLVGENDHAWADKIRHTVRQKNERKRSA